MGHVGVIHVLPERNLQIGGPAYSVPRLADSLAELGAYVQLWSIDAPWLGSTAALHAAQSRLWPTGQLARHCRGYSPGFARALRRACNTPGIDLVHNHGLWMFPNRDARRAALNAGKPLVCSPRGMLEAWSMQRSAWSKRLAWWAFEWRNQQAVSMFHATSESEGQSIRRAGLRQPIALIANGIDEMALPSVQQRAAARGRFNLNDGQRMLLFMSRLHEKKGIVPLLQAWKAQSVGTAHWQLLLAGPDLDGYAAVVRRTIAELDLHAQVRLVGMLQGEAKAAALHAADAFVLPSHSENFGIAVAEAAMAALPVLTTHGTPWQGLVQAGGGWQVHSAVADLSVALADLLSAGSERLRSMGMCARRHVLAHYGWPRIAEQMTQSYQWLLGKSQKPECVWTD